ncbi:hypothetical protein GQ44DRAFT_765791 [Phaeosphaeriaceae sp. PMI808]|nr:hypothetical protein GQ44DRAFT_765791 [Phaeosphaeriaceae sp. PMI808]
MPKLKDLNCSIELSATQKPLQEFGTTYGDGFVETFVPVPSKPLSFSIHLTSNKFIAPGISMYVFVDGVYQCNRNRQDLKLRKGSDNRTLVDFRVRQKEEKQKDGSIIAREWKFEKLNTTLADDSPDVCSSKVIDNLGCIEILVLRCTGPRTAKTVSAMNMDGANDFHSPSFTSDSQIQEQGGRSRYDDRLPFFGDQSDTRRPPPQFLLPCTIRRGYPQPDIKQPSRHSFSHEFFPFISPHRQSRQSRYSEPISPRGNPTGSIPSNAFHYGTGPIPTGSRLNSERSFYHTRPPSLVVTNAPGADPAWLDELLTKAVRRGMEESQRHPNNSQEQGSKELPGAWPQSPVSPGVVPLPADQPLRDDDVQTADTTWDGSQDGWVEFNTQGSEKNCGDWDEESEWDTQSKTEKWDAQDETQSETWDTDETRGTNKLDKKRVNQWSRSRASTLQNNSIVRDVSPATTSNRRSHPSRNDGSRRARSNLRPRSSHWDQGSPSSPEDYNRASYVASVSESLAACEISDSTVLPSQSRSQIQHPKTRSRSKKQLSQKRSVHNISERLSQRSQETARQSTSIGTGRTPSKASRTVQNHKVPPAPVDPPVYLPKASYRSSSFAAPSISNAPLPPQWSTVESETPRKQSFDAAYIPANPPSAINVAEDPWITGKDNKKNWDIDWGAEDAAGSKNEKSWEVNSAWSSKPPAKQDTEWEPNHEHWEPKENTKWESKKKIQKPNPPTPKPTNSPPPQPISTPTPPPSLTTTPSKRHTSKSPLKPRNPQPSSSPSSSSPKPHWQFPPTTPALPPIPEHAPEPLLKLSSKQASEAGIEHQVRAGKGTQYGHVVGRPTYIDALDRPYAVFRFKYRSWGVLGGMFGGEGKEVGSECMEGVARGVTEEWVERHRRG